MDIDIEAAERAFKQHRADCAAEIHQKSMAIKALAKDMAGELDNRRGRLDEMARRVDATAATMHKGLAELEKTRQLKTWISSFF
jgi:hypothetical protein